MTTASKDQITTVQATMIVVNAIIGSGVMTLSRDAGKAVGTPDAWISVILGAGESLYFRICGGQIESAFSWSNLF